MTHKEVEHDIVALIQADKERNKQNRVLREAGRILVSRNNANPVTEEIKFSKGVVLVITVEFRTEE